MTMRLIAVVLSGVLLGCAGAKPKAVHFEGEPDDALVTIEDQYIGKLGKIEKAAVPLKPGTYRVTIEQVGFFPFDVIVTVPDEGEPKTVKVNLEPIPD